MSIGLAVGNIGKFTALYQSLTGKVNSLQEQILALAALSKNADPAKGVGLDANQQELQKDLAIALFMQGQAKDFLEYWKNVLKDIGGMIKSLSELAQGSR